MQFKIWWKKYKDKRQLLAERIGTSHTQLQKYVYRASIPGATRAIAIEETISELTPSDPVNRADLRPDLWTTPQQQ